MVSWILLALFQAAAGDPAPTAPPTAAEAPAEQSASPANAEAPAPEVRRCRREVVTGSRMTRRICSTDQEEQVAQDEARDGINRIQSLMNLNN